MSRFMTHLNNIYQLGLKELKSLWSDKVMLLLIIYAFTANIYSSAKGVSQELHNAPVAIVDQDRSQISMRLANSLTKPYFKTPDLLEPDEATQSLDRGYHSFSIIIPPSFQKDLIAGRKPTVQLNIDATVMSQAFIGSGYIESIFNNEINEYLNRTTEPATKSRINLVTHVRFNPNMTGFWFGGVIQVINNVTMLTIILVGAAYIREREHGTLEHLLAMPLVAAEIMISKIWANGLAVLIGASGGLVIIVKVLMQVPIIGSIPLFLLASAVYLFAAAAIGIFLGTLSKSMPQLGLLIFLTIIPLQMLSGGSTPQESMPEWVQNVMMATPTTYYVKLAQSILFRGAGMSIVWPEFLAMTGVGIVFFALSLARFRKSVIQGN